MELLQRQGVGWPKVADFYGTKSVVLLDDIDMFLWRENLNDEAKLTNNYADYDDLC